MPKPEDRRDENPSPQKSKLSIKHVTAFALIGIFVVLTLANLDSILSPLKKLSNIMAPITIGLVLAYILNFFVRFFEYKMFNKIKKRTVNRALSMLFSYILLLLIIAGFVWLIIPSVVDSVRDLSTNGMSYVTRLIDSINSVMANIPLIPQPEDGSDFLNLEKLLTFALGLLESSGTWIVSNLASIAGGALTILKNIVVGVFISIYVLLSKERLNAGCRRAFRALFSDRNEKRILHYLGKAHVKFGGFLIGKLTDSMLVMLVCMLLFSIFDIPYAILIAVIIGITDIIPFFGPFLGAIPSAVIIFIASPMKAIVFVLLILVVQQIDGNLIAPMILGNRTGLTSLGVIVAVTVTGGVFGIAGMIIGVPLFALIMLLLDDFVKERLEAKGHDTSLKEYYPADAFIRPQDIHQNDETLTKRFVKWVRTVETEETEDATDAPSRSHRASRRIRLACLAVGRFFHRLFSIKPIPEDRTGGIFMDIAKNGMRVNRLFWRTVALTIITLFIYPFYLIEVIAQSTNIACHGDGRRTWGVFPYLLLSIVTLGIFPLIWHCSVISRFQTYCNEHGKVCPISRKFYLCWSLLGLLILVGPAIALARFLRGFREVCTLYNSTHTFPLDAEKMKEEENRLHQAAQKKPRVPLGPVPGEEEVKRIPLIDQILAPVEDDDSDDNE